jgi:phosphohistidine phosphatase
MRLYLVRHGKAEQGGDDWERPLAPRGRRDVSRLAAWLREAGCRVDRVVHSGRARARETAEILSAAIGPKGKVEELRQGLQPEDATDVLAWAAGGWDDDVMAVGHEPFMGRMVAQLLCGNPDAPLAAMKTGAIVCLERTADSGWALCWMITPKLVP